MQVKVLVLGHTHEMLDIIPNKSWMKKIFLPDLPIGKHQRNEFAEVRIFIHDLIHEFEGSEYVGIASASWDKKYKDNNICKLEDLGLYFNHLKPDIMIVPHSNAQDWRRFLILKNPGFGRMLHELCEYTNTGYSADMEWTFGGISRTFWSNNFICHRNIFEEFMLHFRNVFNHFDMKYGIKFPFIGRDRKRTAAHFYEAVTMNYFANRADLTFVEPWNKSI